MLFVTGRLKQLLNHCWNYAAISGAVGLQQKRRAYPAARTVAKRYRLEFCGTRRLEANFNARTQRDPGRHGATAAGNRHIQSPDTFRRQKTVPGNTTTLSSGRSPSRRVSASCLVRSLNGCWTHTLRNTLTPSRNLAKEFWRRSPGHPSTSRIAGGGAVGQQVCVP